MTDAGITLRDIYDQQLRTSTEVAAVRTDVAALKATVGVELAHGAQTMTDLRHDVDALKERVPERAGERLTSLESDRDKGRGSSGAVSKIITCLVAVAGGGIGTALIQAIHH